MEWENRIPDSIAGKSCKRAQFCFIFKPSLPHFFFIISHCVADCNTLEMLFHYASLDLGCVIAKNKELRIT